MIEKSPSETTSILLYVLTGPPQLWQPHPPQDEQPHPQLP
jgi:hypothetical protein